MTFNELLETVPPEVKTAIEEIEHKAGTTDADWEFVKAAGELLAAAKAASVLPVDIVWFYQSGWGQEVNVELKSEEDAVALMKWLRERMKERGEQ